MCFMLYLATDGKIKNCPFNDKTPNVCIESVDDDINLEGIFSLSTTKYIGSDLGCGCGFRSCSKKLNPDLEPENYWVDDEEFNDSAENHQKLKSIIDALLRNGNKVELIGYWAGDEGEPPWSEFDLNISRITEKQFVFFEGVKYKINV